MSTTLAPTTVDTALNDGSGNIQRVYTQTILYSVAEYQAMLTNTQEQITANTQQATVLNAQVTSMQAVLAQAASIASS